MEKEKVNPYLMYYIGESDGVVISTNIQAVRDSQSDKDKVEDDDSGCRDKAKN